MLSLTNKPWASFSAPGGTELCVVRYRRGNVDFWKKDLH